MTLFLFVDGAQKAVKVPSEFSLQASPSLRLEVPASFDDRVLFEGRARLLARTIFRHFGLRMETAVNDYTRHLEVCRDGSEEE